MNSQPQATNTPAAADAALATLKSLGTRRRKGKQSRSMKATSPRTGVRARTPKPTEDEALKAINTQLAALIASRSTVLESLSNIMSQMAFWQDRFNRMEQETARLIQLRQQLNPAVTMSSGIGPVAAVAAMTNASGFNHAAPIPSTIGSIPAPRQPAPNPGGNAADAIVRDGGFS